MSNTPALTVDSPATDQLTGLTPQQNREWLNSGKLPAKESKEASPVKAEESTPAKVETPAEPVKVEEAVPSRKSKTAERFDVLTEHNRQLKESLEAVKAQLAALTAKPGEAKAAAPAAEASDEPKKPKIEDFTVYEEFVEALADWKLETKLAKRESERQQTEAKKKQEDTTKGVTDKFMERLAEAEKKIPDLRAKIMPQGKALFDDVVAGYIIESERGPEIAYKLASEPEELARIQAYTPFIRARELVKIEFALPAQVTPVAPAKKLTETPPPPREVGSGATPPKDALEAAASSGDVGRYLREANQRDLQARKGR